MEHKGVSYRVQAKRLIKEVRQVSDRLKEFKEAKLLNKCYKKKSRLSLIIRIFCIYDQTLTREFRRYLLREFKLILVRETLVRPPKHLLSVLSSLRAKNTAICGAYGRADALFFARLHFVILRKPNWKQSTCNLSEDSESGSQVHRDLCDLMTKKRETSTWKTFFKRFNLGN